MSIKFDFLLRKFRTSDSVTGSPGTVPDASTSTKGIIQLASGAEVTAGTNTAKAVVPSTLKTELDKKVDKVAGKGLSTNDYDNTEKAKVAAAETETTLGIDTASGDTTKFLNQKKQWVVPAGGSGSGPTVELLSVMPTPGIGDVGRVALFTGASTGAYVQNKIYQVVMEGASYVWRPLLPPLTTFASTTPTIYPGGRYANYSPSEGVMNGAFTFNIGGYAGGHGDAEVLMVVPTSGVTVSGGTGLTLVDALTAGKLNCCVIKFTGLTANMFVVHTEDL